MLYHTGANSDFDSHYFRTLSGRPLREGHLTLHEATGKTYDGIVDRGITFELCPVTRPQRTQPQQPTVIRDADDCVVGGGAVLSGC